MGVALSRTSLTGMSHTLKYVKMNYIFCSFMKFNRIKIAAAHYPLPVSSTWAEVVGKDRKCCYRCLIEESSFWNVFA